VKMNVEKIGDWEKAEKFFSDISTNNFIGHTVRLLHRVGLLCVNWVVKAIQNSTAGGKKFPPLHPFTASRRRGGQGSPLMDKGDLIGSVNYVVDSANLEAFVGVLKGKIKDGKDIVDIATILHNGATIPVTKKMRHYLASQGFYLKSSTTHLVIPPRPFLNEIVSRKGEISETLAKEQRKWIMSIIQ